MSTTIKDPTVPEYIEGLSINIFRPYRMDFPNIKVGDKLKIRTRVLVTYVVK